MTPFASVIGYNTVFLCLRPNGPLHLQKDIWCLHVMGLKCLIWLSCLYFVRYRDFIFGPFGLKLPIHAHFEEILADSIP